MKTGIWSAAFGLALVAALGDSAAAQYPRVSSPYSSYTPRFARPRLRPNQRPTVSPYVNLLSGRGVGYEYYGRVRPQKEFRNTNALIGSSIQNLEAATRSNTSAIQTGVGTTGHVTAFQNQYQYFGVTTAPPGLNQTTTTQSPPLTQR